MSKTGIELCSIEVMQQLAIVCSFVCMCKDNGGQKCVDISLLSYNNLNKNSQILVEHPYYLPKTGDPVPIMNSGGWNDYIPSLGRLIGSSRLAKTDGVPQDIIDAYLRRETNMKGIRTDYGIENIESYTKGELSIPDTVIVKDRNQPAIRDNLLGVGEIKFPPDDWDDDQYRAAKRIAGEERNVHTLSPKSCGCGDKKQKPEPQLVRKPTNQSSTQPIPQGAVATFFTGLAGLAIIVMTRGAINNAVLNGGVLTVPTDYPNDGGMI